MRRRHFTAFIGAAMASPGARAQAKTYKIGFLTLDPTESASVLAKPLEAMGYVAGRNLALDYRSADGDPARLPALAADLVRTSPDVLVAGWGTLAPKALKAATSTVPIVFATAGDPLGAGLVQSLARPGGNVTGMSGQSSELKGKQLQLLLTVLPGQKVVGAVVNPETPYGLLALKETTAAAEKQGVRLEVMEARRPAEFTAARMDSLVAAGATSLMIIEDPMISSIRVAIMAEAARLKLPTITSLEEFIAAGVLMRYGASQAERYRNAASYVDRILKGARPADLPVLQPTKFDLAISKKAAQTIGLAFPPSLLAQADEVIE
jgi:putative ABC transport system substrate-binding protein